MQRPVLTTVLVATLGFVLFASSRGDASPEPCRVAKGDSPVAKSGKMFHGGEGSNIIIDQNRMRLDRQRPLHLNHRNRHTRRTRRATAVSEALYSKSSATFTARMISLLLSSRTSLTE